VENPNIAIQTGMISPPPPIPPLFAKPKRSGSIIVPPISDQLAGNTSLCAHKLFWHFLKAEFTQSAV